MFVLLVDPNPVSTESALTPVSCPGCLKMEREWTGVKVPYLPECPELRALQLTLVVSFFVNLRSGTVQDPFGKAGDPGTVPERL